MAGNKVSKEGHLFIAQHEIRNAIVTADATLSSSDAALTSLIAGDSDYFLDIFEISFANSSNASVGIDLGNDGTIIRHVDIPAGNTVQLMYDAPLKQITKNLPWTLDISGSDITGSTLKVYASLVKKDGK